MSKSVKAECWDRSSPICLRNYHTYFHGSYTSLYSDQQLISVSLTSHSCQNERSVVLLIWVILIAIRWNQKVVLSWISLIAKDVVHFFKHFLAIWIFSFGNSCSCLYLIFNSVIVCLISSLIISLYILDISSPPGMYFKKSFPTS